MRLTCPNCAAQYEIDASLLPEEGREVQCSACGHIWFQEASGVAPRPATPDLEQTASPEAPTTPSEAEAHKPDTADLPMQDDAEPGSNDEDAPLEDLDAPAAAQSAPKPVNENVLGILRQEAAYEADQRAREADRLESQPELGLLGAAPWPKTADTDPEPEERIENDAGHSKVAFPDIEDISSTLEPIGATRKSIPAEIGLPETSDAKKRSFLSGLLIPISIALILVALYIAAPALAEAVPALASILAGYVGLVDTAREVLSGLVGR